MPNTPHHTSENYLSLLQAGEEKAFDFFFHRHYAALSLFAFRLTADRPAAEEIAADAFLKCWDRRVNFTSEQGIRSFLFLVARNACYNWLRQQKRMVKRAQELSALPPEKDPTVIEHIVAAEVYADIHRAIETLPPQCGKIFRMLFIEGKDYSEVARELSLSVSTVRNQKARAVALLKERVSLSLTLLILIAIS